MVTTTARTTAATATGFMVRTTATTKALVAATEMARNGDGREAAVVREDGTSSSLLHQRSPLSDLLSASVNNSGDGGSDTYCPPPSSPSFYLSRGPLFFFPFLSFCRWVRGKGG
ncbi:uncharacterized protein DS421_5g150740 [Arachis hypogaea]|nr:uncharacterized protein DS421_5g150740 [Arachis hypogaea]